MHSKFKILFLIVLIAIACNREHYIISTTQKKYVLTESKPNKATEQLITPFKNKVDSITNSVVVMSDGVFTKDGNNNSLGNFSCDAIYTMITDSFKYKIDIVLLNKGGLRANLPQGEIKVSNLFELMPFENELVMVQVTGKQLAEGIKRMIEKKAIFRGIKIKGTTENYNISIQQNQLHPDSSYSILTSDYLATGGDNYDFLKSARTIKFLNFKIRDALILYCKKVNALNKSIKPYTDDRFSIN